MTDLENWLLTTRLRALRPRLGPEGASEPREAAWREAWTAIGGAGEEENADLALPVMERDLAALDALLAGWEARKVPLPAWDQAVLKRALNAFKRRLKLTRADDEVTSSRNPFSRGASSGIQGVRPPEGYTRDVWDLLIAQGRLRDGGGGLLEPGGGAD
jgi:hypothetical protein